MPLFFAPLVGWTLGAALAWFARGELARDDIPTVASRPFVVTCLFAAMVYGPMLAYFAAFHGDWAYLYLVPWRKVPSALDLGLVLVGAVTVPVGMWAASRFSRQGRVTLVGALAAPAALLTLVGAGVLQHRLATSASYAQFHGGFGTVPISEAPLGKSVIWMLLVLGAAFAFCIASVRAAPEPRAHASRAPTRASKRR